MSQDLITFQFVNCLFMLSFSFPRFTVNELLHDKVSSDDIKQEQVWVLQGVQKNEIMILLY